MYYYFVIYRYSLNNKLLLNLHAQDNGGAWASIAGHAVLSLHWLCVNSTFRHLSWSWCSHEINIGPRNEQPNCIPDS